MAEKKRPKLRMDVRRSLMCLSLDTYLPHNKLSVGPDYLRECAVLRFRTLRMFFCSRSFVIAFFTPSKNDRWAVGQRRPIFDPTIPSLGSVSFSLHLKKQHLRAESMVLLMQLGQRDARCLRVHIDECQETFECVRKTAFMLAALQSLPHLKAFKLEVVSEHKVPWLLQLLRDFLPSSISEISSVFPQHFLLLVLPSLRAADKAVCYPDRDRPQDLVPVFRSRARVIVASGCVAAIAANGQLELNERVERLVVHLQTYPMPDFPYNPVSDPSAYEQGEREFRTAVQNLCTLNDSFVLHVRFAEHTYRNFSGWREHFDHTLSWLAMCAEHLAANAKPAGHPNVQISAKIDLPNPKKDINDYERVRAAAAQFFSTQPNFTRTTENFDADLAADLADGRERIVDMWTASSHGMALNFVFVEDLHH
ncbi:hypothetical protein M3Y99_01533600 [Aphelenchoides fujianensis]|nr:hypothetical protein M3Y99_01533600 [Aphelenchoides fujianensis]